MTIVQRDGQRFLQLGKTVVPYACAAVSDLSTWQLIALIAAGAVATALNTLAGGGSLVSFPVLVALGVPPITANATNAFALTLGGLSGALGSTGSINHIWPYLIRYVPATLAGAVLGAWLLLSTTQRLFDLIVPALLLVATALLAVRNLMSNSAGEPQSRTTIIAPFCMLGAALYGGYFGAGQGIVFLAFLEWFVPGSLQDNNAIKNWLQCLVTIVAAGIFFAKGDVLIIPGLALMAGGLVGGYAAGLLSQRLDPKPLRMGMVVYGSVMTLWFATKTFGHS